MGTYQRPAFNFSLDVLCFVAVFWPVTATTTSTFATATTTIADSNITTTTPTTLNTSAFVASETISSSVSPATVAAASVVSKAFTASILISSDGGYTDVTFQLMCPEGLIHCPNGQCSQSCEMSSSDVISTQETSIQPTLTSAPMTAVLSSQPSIDFSFSAVSSCSPITTSGKITPRIMVTSISPTINVEMTPLASSCLDSDVTSFTSPIDNVAASSTPTFDSGVSSSTPLLDSVVVTSSESLLGTVDTSSALSPGIEVSSATDTSTSVSTVIMSTPVLAVSSSDTSSILATPTSHVSMSTDAPTSDVSVSTDTPMDTSTILATPSTAGVTSDVVTTPGAGTTFYGTHHSSTTGTLIPHSTFPSTGSTGNSITQPTTTDITGAGTEDPNIDPNSDPTGWNYLSGLVPPKDVNEAQTTTQEVTTVGKMFSIYETVPTTQRKGIDIFTQFPLIPDVTTAASDVSATSPVAMNVTMHVQVLPDEEKPKEIVAPTDLHPETLPPIGEGGEVIFDKITTSSDLGTLPPDNAIVPGGDWKPDSGFVGVTGSSGTTLPSNRNSGDKDKHDTFDILFLVAPSVVALLTVIGLACAIRCACHKRIKRRKERKKLKKELKKLEKAQKEKEQAKAHEENETQVNERRHKHKKHRHHHKQRHAHENEANGHVTQSQDAPSSRSTSRRK